MRMARIPLLVFALLSAMGAPSLMPLPFPVIVGRTPRSAAGPLAGLPVGTRVILMRRAGPGGPARTGGSAPRPAAPDSAAFDGILKRYVEENGTVRYGALRMALDRLSLFVGQVGAVSPDSHPTLFPTRAHRLAYWLNTYNAWVLWAMAKEYPEKKGRLGSPAGQEQFFQKTLFKTGGRERSLDDIE